LVIRAGLRQPESRLGFVTFKDKTVGAWSRRVQ
jgi:hypothetical protein